MNTAKATALAARIVSYCCDNALGLDGIEVELSAGELLDAERAKRLTTYCDQVKCLTLGGLVDEVWELRNEYAEAGNTSVRKATMRHTATLEVELAFNRAKSLAGVNLANAVDELASAWNEMSGEALRDELRKLVNAHKVHVNGAHTARVNAGVHGVDRKVFADEI